MPYLTLYNTPRMRFAQDIACACNWQGYDCYIVGGWVRDTVLGLEPKDLDMMTSLPLTYLKNLPVENCTMVPTGEQYGTITFVRDGMSIEVTVCREDFGDQDATDNRKDVHPTFININTEGPVKDVKRRDFTINGLIVDPFSGVIYDSVGGFDDLICEQLRFIGNPVDRCREDALRVFRYIRFAARFPKFKIDPVIFDVVQDSVVQTRLELLSAERVRDEFTKTLTVKSGNAAAWALTMYHELGLLDMWFPELIPMVDQEQNIYHTEDVWGHTLMAVEYSKPNLLHRLFALWHDLGKPETAEFKAEEYGYSFHDHASASARITKTTATRLKFGHKEPVNLDFLCFLIEHHMDAFVIGKTSKMLQRVGIAKFGEELGAQYVLDTAWDVGRSDFFARAPVSHAGDKIKGGDEKLKKAYGIISEYIHDKKHPALSTRTLEVNGQDVMQIMGLKPGPEVGKVLNELLLMVQNDYLPNERDALLEALRSGFRHFEGGE